MIPQKGFSLKGNACVANSVPLGNMISLMACVSDKKMIAYQIRDGFYDTFAIASFIYEFANKMQEYDPDWKLKYYIQLDRNSSHLAYFNVKTFLDLQLPVIIMPTHTVSTLQHFSFLIIFSLKHSKLKKSDIVLKCCCEERNAKVEQTCWRTYMIAERILEVRFTKISIFIA